MYKENDTKNKKFPEAIIEKIKSRIDIVDFISSHQSITPQGKTYKTQCPICKSKTALVIFPESQSFHCFACLNRGDIFSYAMQVKDKDYSAAVEDLASFAHVDVFKFDRIERAGLMRDAARYFHAQLRDNPKSQTAIDILHSWGIQGKTIVQLGIGFHDASFNSFVSYMSKQKKYSFQELESANLVYQSSIGNFCDKMRNSIIIPTINGKGQVVCFDFYVIDKKQHYKYPNTNFYQRSENLYSYNLAIKSKKQSAIVVSSYEDYFRLIGKGITNVVSTYLPKITEQQMKLLKRRFKVVLLLTHHHANIPSFKVFCKKNNMYCEEFNVNADKTIVEFIDTNESEIKERVDYFESIFNNKQS